VSIAQSQESIKKQETKTSVKQTTPDVERKLSTIPKLDILIDFVIEDDIMKDDDDASSNGILAENHLNDLNAGNNTKNNNDASPYEGVMTNTIDNSATESVKIFPMPAISYFNIQLENSNINNYKLINAAGQVIENKLLNGNSTTVEVKTTNLAKGMYFIVINTNSTPISKSIIIQ